MVVWMNLLKRTKVKTKVILSYLIVDLLIGILGFQGILSLKTVAGNSEEMYNSNLQSVYTLTEMEKNLVGINNDICSTL
jgi:methyl-accepting chemotaxis protein